MTELETALLAARLVGVSATVLLAPGLLLLAVLGAPAYWTEHIVLAFSLSYCWIFALSIVVPVFGLNVDAAVVLTLTALAVLGVVAFRRRSRLRFARSLDRWDLLLAGLVLAAAVAAWIIEPSFTGEEALDLASISRFADGGPISFSNTSLFPDTRPVYLVQPYQLALGVIARWSGVDPLIAFIKFRVVLVPLALIFLFNLVHRLTGTRADAAAVFVVMLFFIGLDFQTWEMNSLFPLVRRGGVGAALCVPAMLALCLAATRTVEERTSRFTRQIAFCAAPVMLVASLATHPLEMFTVLYFAAAMTLVITTGLDSQGDRRRAAMLMFLLVAAAGVYVAVQTRLVPYVAEYESDQKGPLRTELARLALHPIAAVAGRPAPAADLLTRTIPATTATVFGMIALPVAALRLPATAAMLAVGIVPLAVIYATPAGFILLTLLTSVETVRDVNAYFGLLGLIALAIALTAAAHAALNAAGWRPAGFRRVVTVAFGISLAAFLVVSIGRPASRALAAEAILRPGTVLAIGVAAALATLIVVWRIRQPLIPASRYAHGVAVLAACLAIPFALPEAGLGGVFTRREPTNVMTRITTARATPSVLEWPAYYPRLQTTIAPPLPVPRAVVDELRRRIPPRQIVLADPRYSCALVVLIDAYCINPVSIYGHYFQPAVAYFRDYVKERGSDTPEHPFFNSTASVSDAERALIQQYHVAYVLTDPEFGDLIASKLTAVVSGITLETTVEGYRLYRVTAPAARTSAR